MQRLENNWFYHLFIFSAGLVIALYSVNYFTYLFYHASGVHFWRQADSFSFVAHYYERGMNFFEPGTCNVSAKEARGASEFPILYYITAMLWHVFGRHDSILKIIHSLIFFTGFYCLFKIAIKQIGNVYTALGVTLLLLSSSVLLFYANSSLPDAAALGFCLTGAYFYFNFTHNQSYINYVIAFGFFTLSVLLKVSMAVFPLAVFGMLFLEKVARIKVQNTPVFSGRFIKYTLPPVIMLALVIFWVLWTKHYNAINQNDVFLTNIKPYWKASPQEIKNTTNNMTDMWYPHYFPFTTWYVIYSAMLIGLINIKKWTTHNRWLALALVCGTAIYFVLFFIQFEAHDYYIIPLFIPLAFILIFSFNSFSNRFQWFKILHIPGLALLVVAYYAFTSTNEILRYRTDFATWSDMNTELFELTGKLENYGIPKGERIFCFPDHTPNASLYYLQREGYTNSSGYNPEEVPPIIKPFIFYGIRYLVITNPAYYYLAESKWYWSKEVGSYKHIKMYYITGFRGDWAD